MARRQVCASGVTALTLTGTPAAPTEAVAWTLIATDADGDTATLTFTVEVAPPDLMPTFGDAQVPAQRYVQDVAIAPLTLPAATGGDGPLTYTLTGPGPGTTPALPEGLAWSESAVAYPTQPGVLAGIPTVPAPPAAWTLAATDADGDRATLTFPIKVLDRLRERLKGVNAALLPDLSRTMTASTLDAMAGRIGQALAPTADPMASAQMLDAFAGVALSEGGALRARPGLRARS